jgi:hypothetical protein
MQGVTAIAIASSTLSPLSKVRRDRNSPTSTEKAITLCLVCEGDRSTKTLLEIERRSHLNTLSLM